METPSSFAQAIAAELRGERAAQQLSLDDLVEKSSIPRATLQRYLAGERDIPTSKLNQIAQGLGITVSDITARAERRTS